MYLWFDSRSERDIILFDKNIGSFFSSVYRVSSLWKLKPVKIFHSLDIAYKLQLSLKGYHRVNLKNGLFEGK